MHLHRDEALALSTCARGRIGSSPFRGFIAEQSVHRHNSTLACFFFQGLANESRLLGIYLRSTTCCTIFATKGCIFSSLRPRGIFG